MKGKMMKEWYEKKYMKFEDEKEERREILWRR